MSRETLKERHSTHLYFLMVNNMDYLKLGANLDAIRKARGFTQDRLAKAINTNPSTVNHHLKTGRMSLESLVTYAEQLGCDTSVLLDGCTDMTQFTLEDDLSERYPWNLAAAIIGSTEQNDLYGVYVPGLLESLETLTEREQKVLMLRFRHGLTLEQTARQMGLVSRERIRQVEQKAMRKLRHPSRCKLWRLSSDSLIAKAWDMMAEASSIKLENINLSARLNALCEKYNEDPCRKPEKQKEPQKDVDIEDLELSVRSYNCLRRAGVKTISDMQGWTMNDLMKVRNLGRKSLDEIVTKLNERGIVVPLEEG